MSEFPFWVSSLLLSLSEPVCSPSACQLLYLSALSHTLPLFYFHNVSLSAYSLSLWVHNARPCRVVSWIIYACLCSCRRRRWLSQKHSDRGIVSARGTLENQCSSLPRRVRLCSKPSTDCIPLSLSRSICEKERKTNRNSTTWSVQQSEPLDYRARFSKLKHTKQKYKIYKLFSFETHTNKHSKKVMNWLK